MAQSSALLFVYGTLTTAVAHPLGEFLRENGVPAGRGSFAGRLYVIDDPDDRGVSSYPGAVLSSVPGERVHGELYEIAQPAVVLERLDAYEACSPAFPEPHEFVRRMIGVDVGLGRQVEAWTYLYNFEWNLATAIHLPGGRYGGEVWEPMALRAGSDLRTGSR